MLGAACAVETALGLGLTPSEDQWAGMSRDHLGVRDPLQSTRLYADETLEALVGILGRTGGESSIDPFLLERDLRDLFRAAGLPADDSEKARLFGEFSENEPTHARLARLFGRMALAEDPFAAKADYDLALPQLNAKARWARRIRRGALGRVRPLIGVRWTDLSDSERADVREMARELARYHQSFVRRGMPFKDDQDTLLDGLANIFVQFTGFELHRCDLPHAEQSRFIGFAHRALRPFFSMMEVSVKALSRRWQRLKAANRRSQPSD